MSAHAAGGGGRGGGWVHLASVGGKSSGVGVQPSSGSRRPQAHILAANHLSQQVVLRVRVRRCHLQHDANVCD